MKPTDKLQLVKQSKKKKVRDGQTTNSLSLFFLSFFLFKRLCIWGWRGEGERKGGKEKRGKRWRDLRGGVGK